MMPWIKVFALMIIDWRHGIKQFLGVDQWWRRYNSFICFDANKDIKGEKETNIEDVVTMERGVMRCSASVQTLSLQYLQCWWGCWVVKRRIVFSDYRHH